MVDDKVFAASAADATAAGNGEVDSAGVDVADLPRIQRCVVAQTRLGRAGPQHSQVVLVEFRRRDLRHSVDAMSDTFQPVTGDERG